MANKEWDTGSAEKKLEMLRKDIERIYKVVSTLADDMRSIRGSARTNEGLLHEVAEAVEAIEKRMMKPGKK